MLISGLEIEVAVNKFVRRFLCGALLPLIALTLVRVWITWRNDAYLGHVSGVWMALASDLNAGIFYRPLVSELGYGATRYFPLHFVLQVVLIKAGFEARVAGHLIELASMVVLLGGIYLLLRSLRVERWFAAAAPFLILATGPGQLALLTIRGDVLASALSILGIAVCVREPRRSWHEVTAAALFALAFSAKQTTVFGIAAVVLMLLFSRRSSAALRLTVMTAAGYVGVLAIMNVASHGRVFEIMRVAGMAGATWKNLLTGPVRLALTAYHDDPVANTSIIILGLGAFIAPAFDSRCLLPRTFLLTTLALTSLIMGTPGTAYNHLLDLNVACLVMFAVWASCQEKRFETFNIGVLAVTTALVLPTLVQLIRHHDRVSNLREERQHVLQVIGGSPEPFLAEDPLLPVLAGRTPYILDPGSFRALDKWDPSSTEPLLRRLREQSFSAVVLMSDPRSAEGRVNYEKERLSSRIIEQVEKNYSLADGRPGAYVFLPKR